MYEYAAELAKCVVLVFQTAKGTGVSTSRTSYALETGRAQRDTETWQGREVIEKKKKKSKRGFKLESHDLKSCLEADFTSG